VVGKSASSDEDPIVVGSTGVWATGWLRDLLVLPSETCRVPRKRQAVERKDESR
jgi:hypothetical protein